MKEKRVDATGLACPQPVLLMKKAMQEAREEATIEVLVDNPASRDHCSRIAAKAGWTVDVDLSEGQVYRLVLRR